MTSAREKRLLLGVLAFLAPVPLPFNQVLEWPALLVYLAAAGWFLHRARREREDWLPPWAMNLLGLVYLPFFLFDLLVYSHGALVRPVVHLALFAVLVKLFSLRRERDKWQVLIGIFFLFLAGTATSVHPTVVLYLLAFLVLSLLLLARFAYLHLLAGFARGGATSVRVPLKGVLAVSVVLSILLAIPLFALLPRVSSPYFTGPALGGGRTQSLAGLSDEVTLDTIGSIRNNPAVALRIRFGEGSTYLGERRGSPRFKAGTFDRYEKQRWWRSPVGRDLGPAAVAGAGGGGGDGPEFRLAAAAPLEWAEVWLRPLGSVNLVLPLEASRLRIRRSRLYRGEGGAVFLPNRPDSVLRYRVGLAGEPALLPPAPDLPVPSAVPAARGSGGGRQELDGALDLSGVTPGMARLAREVMGQGSDRQRVERLESHFHGNFRYTLSDVGRTGDDRLEDFLFRTRAGHCEYFATAMVLMLRSQDVPARLVTGFLGGELNFFESYFVVRQSNAHAWVEAYLPDEGRWAVFDPTPPVGRPGLTETTLWSLAAEAYDNLLFRWDRYVLSYDQADQVSIFASLHRAWERLREWLRESDQPEVGGPARGGDQVAAGPAGPEEPWWRRVSVSWILGVTVGLALLGAVWILWRHRSGSLTVEAAYLRLRRELDRRGLEVGAADPPLELRRRALELCRRLRCPGGPAPAGRVFDLYLEHSYAGRPLGPGQMEELEQSLARAVKGLRKAPGPERRPSPDGPRPQPPEASP